MSTELQSHGETIGMDLQKPTQLKKNQKMTLEQYIDFFNSHNQSNLTSVYLKQIITMHAFKLIQCVPKQTLVEAVKVIDLMEPAGRSTLNNNAISSCTSLTLEEAIKDLASLKWQECCVTSLDILNFDQLDFTTATATATTLTWLSSSNSKSKCDSSSSYKKESELPAGAGPGCGKVSESVTCKGRKRKGMSSVML